MDVPVHHLVESFNALDPVIFDRVWEATEDVITVLHASRYDLVHQLVLSVVIHEVQHVDRPACLTEPLDPSQPLLEPRRVPGKINVDKCAESLKVQTLASGV